MKRTHLALCIAALAVALSGPLSYMPYDFGILARATATSDNNQNKDGSNSQRTLESDHFWQQESVSEVSGTPSIQLNTPWWEETLRTVPLETLEVTSGTPSGTIVTLPAPDGTLHSFSVVKSLIMEAALAARYPQLQTFAAKGVNDPTATARFSWTPAGLHAIILSAHETYFVEPKPGGKQNEYHSFTLAEMLRDKPKFSCDVRAAEIAPHLSRQVVQGNPVTGANLRIYRLAMASTGEYTQQWGGGTVSGGLAAVTIIVNQVNAIFERDVAVRLMLINRADEIIFTNPVTDGYTSGNAVAMLNENPARLNAILGAESYDIGHVVDRNTNNVGGRAIAGDVCGLSKAGGVSIMAAGPSHSYTPYIVSHEIGHQFGGLHTFNGTTDFCATNRTAISAYEPGSGSTLLGYRFNCGDEDLVSFSLYFHTFSIQQMNSYITATGPNSGACAVSQATGNQPPVVTGGSDANIPARTPFKLTAEGFDENGDALTYTWEQLDLGAPAPPNTDDGFRPIFRSFDPSPRPERSFPRLEEVLSNTPLLGESLPTTTRVLNFRVTVRDNHLPGGTASDDVRLQVHGNTGPFQLTSPTLNANWIGGTTQEVTWEVAGTNAPPINTAQVRLMLSVDGGQSFPYVLADATPNDGTQPVILPNVSSSGTARIKAEAVGNSFYNISPHFTLSAGEQTTSTVQAFLTQGAETGEGTAQGFSLTVARNGNTALPVRVDYATSDGTAEQRGDYVTMTGTLDFASGETAKTITIPIVDDAYDEIAETFRLTLDNIQGATLAGSGSITITINDNDMGLPNGPNPLENREFFVQQQYYDFLNRIPDTAGFNYWTNELNLCGADVACLRLRRIGVSAAFFVELEFQETGSVVYRMHRAAFGSLAPPHQTRANVTYAQFTTDRAQLIGGASLPQSTVAFAQRFAQRSAFLALYPTSQTNAQFVNALFDRASLTPFALERQAEIDAMNTQGRTRAEVLLNVINLPAFRDREYPPSFVLMQYFGYLRRDPDQAGYDFWLNILNTPPHGPNGMVCAFITSAEYQARFSSIISRTNSECGGL